MTGIMIAAQGAGKTTAAPPAGPFEVGLSWNGTNPQNVAGLSGQTGNVFAASFANAVSPVSRTWSVQYDGGGKLSITVVGNGAKVNYDNMALGESQIIVVNLDATDAAGNHDSANAQVTIKRTS